MAAWAAWAVVIFGGGRAGKVRLELLWQQLQIGFWLRVAREGEFAPVAGGDAHINHLHGGDFANTLRGVRPGARCLRRWPSVTCRQ